MKLLDKDLRLFAYRSTVLYYIEDRRQDLADAIRRYLHPHLSNPVLAAEHADAIRGPQLGWIIGHYRQYSQVSNWLPGIP